MFENPTDQNLPICLSFQRAWFLLDLNVEATKPNKPRMKRIEAVVKRSALDDFHRCAQQLGIFGFDLSEERKLPNHQPPTISSEGNSHTPSRLKVDFAVLDEEVKPTIHAVLESVHPNSIAVFKFDQDTQPPRRDSLRKSEGRL
jgi:nitrogen regulatory protein PII